MNCPICRTGVLEMIGEYTDYNLTKFKLTDVESDNGVFNLHICSNPICNHVEIIAHENTLYKLKNQIREMKYKHKEVV